MNLNSSAAASHAARLQAVATPDIIKMRIECERLGAINLAAGTCEFDPPPALISGARKALEGNGNLYSLPSGILELRQAISRKVKRDNGLDAAPDSEIFVTAGATAAFASTVMALLNPGDGIILIAPYYAWHHNASLIAGCIPSYAQSKAPDYRITIEMLEAAWTPASRALVLCTPSNPTGRVYDGCELQIIAEFANRHDLLVITDETYEYMVFDGHRHISPGSLPDMVDRTVTIMSCSKTYNITGWRIGYVIANAERIRAISLVHDAFYTCAPTPLQHGAASGLDLPQDYYVDLRAANESRRNKVVAALREGGFDPLVPNGTCFILAGYSRHHFTSADEAASQILQLARVAVVSGRAFSTQGRENAVVRICFGRKDAELDEACDRLRRF